MHSPDDDTQCQPSRPSDHGSERSLNTSYRTKSCRNYPLGRCRFGDRCAYLHDGGRKTEANDYVVMQPSPLHHLMATPFAGAGPQRYPSFTAMSFAPESLIDDYSSSDVSSVVTDEIHSPSQDEFSDHEDSVEIIDHAYPPPPPGTPMSFNGSAKVAYGEMNSPMSAGSAHRSMASATHVSLDGDAGPQSVHRKGVFYKTKPCKFYHAKGSCIKGDRCNFIHGPRATTAFNPASGSPKTPSSPYDGKRMVSPGASESDRTMHREAHELPRNPLNGLEEKHTKNYYPVTWRVIGGGVMMGGQREICRDFMVGCCVAGDDCKFAHPESDQGECSSLAAQNTYGTLAPAFVMPDVDDEGYRDSYLSSLDMQPSMSLRGSQSPKNPSRRNPRRQNFKKLTVIPPRRTERVELGYSAHRIVDGSTLLDHATSEPQVHTDSDMPNDVSASSARTLIRPLSTPPSLSTTHNIRLTRLFAAEMP